MVAAEETAQAINIFFSIKGLSQAVKKPSTLSIASDHSDTKPTKYTKMFMMTPFKNKCLKTQFLYI